MRMRSEAGPVAERSGAMAASGGGGQRCQASSHRGGSSSRSHIPAAGRSGSAFPLGSMRRYFH